MGTSVRNFGSLKRLMKRPHVLDVRFHLSHKHFNLVWEVTKEWHKYSVSKSGDPSHRMVSLFNRAMNCGVSVDEKKNRDIVALWHKGDWALGKQHWRFFQLIAKYVTAGSYLNLMESKFEDEEKHTLDDHIRRPAIETFRFCQWYFNGDCMIEKAGQLVFE